MCIYFIAAFTLIFTAKYIRIKIAAFDYKRLRSWSKEVLLWLRRGKDVFGGAFVAVAFVAICWILEWNNKAFTALGCVLELAGLAQAIISLFDVREYFNHPRLVDICRKWIKERPRFKISSDTIILNATIRHEFSSSFMMIPFEIDTSKPLDEILKRLAENTKIFSELAMKNLSEHSLFDQNIKGLRADIENKIDATKAENKKELEHLHLGDLTPTLVGFAWIAAGTIMSAIGSLLP